MHHVEIATEVYFEYFSDVSCLRVVYHSLNLMALMFNFSCLVHQWGEARVTNSK